MIAISDSDRREFGCPYCGCDTALVSGSFGGGTFPVSCIECKKNYVVLADGISRSTMGFGTNKKDINGKIIFEYPVLSEHPRKGISAHKYVAPDVKPENGDYCSPRGVGYDLACFVKTKMAGERIVEMVKEFEDKGVSCWLDYREHEPNWIQVKFSTKEKIREYFLDGKLKENDKIITKELLEEVLTMPINYTNTTKYYRGFDLASWFNLVDVLQDFKKYQNGGFESNQEIDNNPLDFYQRMGLFLVIDVFENKNELENCKLVSSYAKGLNDEYNSWGTKINSAHIADLLKLYNEEFHADLYTGPDKRTYDIYDGYDYSDYISIQNDSKKIEDMLSKLDYSLINKLAGLYNAENKNKIKETISDVNINDIYPLFTLFGLLSTLKRREVKIDESDLVNRHRAMLRLQMLFHVASINIDNNPYQGIFDIISDTVSKYKLPEEKNKENIINKG